MQIICYVANFKVNHGFNCADISFSFKLHTIWIFYKDSCQGSTSSPQIWDWVRHIWLQVRHQVLGNQDRPQNSDLSPSALHSTSCKRDWRVMHSTLLMYYCSVLEISTATSNLYEVLFYNWLPQSYLGPHVYKSLTTTPFICTKLTLDSHTRYQSLQVNGLSGIRENSIKTTPFVAVDYHFIHAIHRNNMS